MELDELYVDDEYFMYEGEDLEPETSSDNYFVYKAVETGEDTILVYTQEDMSEYDTVSIFSKEDLGGGIHLVNDLYLVYFND